MLLGQLNRHTLLLFTQQHTQIQNKHVLKKGGVFLQNHFCTYKIKLNKHTPNLHYPSDTEK